MLRNKKTNKKVLENQTVPENSQSAQQSNPNDVATTAIPPVHQRQQQKSENSYTGNQKNRAARVGNPIATNYQEPNRHDGVPASFPNLGDDNFPPLGTKRTKPRATPQTEQIAEQLSQLQVQDQKERNELPTDNEQTSCQMGTSNSQLLHSNQKQLEFAPQYHLAYSQQSMPFLTPSQVTTSLSLHGTPHQQQTIIKPQHVEQVQCYAKAQQHTPQPRVQSTTHVNPQKTKMVLPSKVISDGSTVTATEDDEPVPTNFRRGGTQGRKIQVFANHFPLRLSPKITTAYQYDVIIEPNKPTSLLPMVMQQLQRTAYPHNYPAYDGKKNLISAYELPLILPFTGVVKVLLDEYVKKYFVKIQLASVVDLTALKRFFNQRYENEMAPPMHVLQCLDIVLRSRPSTTMIVAARSFFSIPDQIVKLGNGMEMYYGFHQSAILGWKPFLNVDVVHKAFPSNMSLLDLIKDIDQNADLSQNISRFMEKKISNIIYNLKIEYKIPGMLNSRRTYRCHGLEKNANLFLFTIEKGKVVNVAQYFEQFKKFKLKYPHLPCLWVGCKKKNTKVVVPMEFCSIIADQVTNRKMDDLQIRNMIKNTTTSTNVRLKSIYNSMKIANHNASLEMQEFGLSVDSNMTEVIGRVLSPPTIKYSNCNRQVNKGEWKSGHFYSPATLNKWSILCMDPGTKDCNIQELKEQFVRQGTLSKMTINPDITITRLNFHQLSEDNMYNVLYQHFSQYLEDKTQLVVVILNERRSDSYNYVKRVAEIATGCLTQCLRPSTMLRLTPRTIDNILLKANVKLNGINFVWLERPVIMNRPIIIMGADVSHPGPDSNRNTPSIAAVTASQDPQAAVYNIIYRFQDPQTEIVTDLEVIARCQLMIFFEKTHYKPEKIIFYRDGISDGQFAAVRKTEIQAIQKACISLNAHYKPAVTFLVVQKRHHTRLFPCRVEDTADNRGNVPAGTCVDTNITHPISQDFYLVSHAPEKGVAKPTKYRTLWDDSDFSDDQIEQLTYYLCHIFARCNRSVSYPTPTYYAHLAAARVKAYIDGRQDLSDLNKLQNLTKIAKEIQVDHPLFFI